MSTPLGSAVDRKMNKAENILSIVVPCYDEADVLPETIKRLRKVLVRLIDKGDIDEESRLWFIDDGSADGTWPLIAKYASEDPRIRGIKLSRNRGHQNALLAGLLTAKGDAIISVDADLQDDVDVIEEMVSAWRAGIDIVYGVRKVRQTDSFFKRQTAQIYYRLLRLFGVDAIYNHADFRLISRRAVEALREYPEVNLFLRGMVRHVGFASRIVEYDRRKRFAGQTKYSLRHMIALAIDGVTSFTAAPLRFIAILGIFVFLASISMIIWVIWVRMFNAEAVPGWASSVIPVYFLGGIQLLSIGVLGEYIAKVYFESKRRPRYIIDEIL